MQRTADANRTLSDLIQILTDESRRTRFVEALADPLARYRTGERDEALDEIVGAAMRWVEDAVKCAVDFAEFVDQYELPDEANGHNRPGPRARGMP